jgi:hypothetical protein
MLQQTLTVAPVARVDGSGQPADTGPIITPNGAVNSTALAPHALALASAVDGLSDNNLRQLMSDLNSFDALPATEPGPAITVDNSDSLDQGSR